MYLITSSKTTKETGPKGATRVAVRSVRAGEQRSTTSVTIMSPSAARAAVDSLVSRGAMTSRGEMALNSVNIDPIGRGVITKVAITSFDRKGRAHKVRVSKIAETTGDATGFWTDAESRKAAKADKRKARKDRKAAKKVS